MSRLRNTLFSTALIVLGLAPIHAQQNPDRLILKDGSYQVVTKYEVVGDRVRYYSAERYDWEELPKAMVDWAATEAFNKDHDARRTLADQEAAKAVAADEKAEEAARPTVAPGIRLPDSGGVFLLDRYQEQPQLAELVQSGGELNKHTGKNILIAAVNPLALSSKQTIELKGTRARVQSHVQAPEIFVNVDSGDGQSSGNQPAAPTAKPGDTDTLPDRYRIVRLKQEKDRRIVGNVNIAIYGKVSQKEDWIRTNATPLGDWVKVTPAQPLDPGEYALVEMLDAKQMNLYVWDFGVDPRAPANPTAWVPRQPEPNKTGTTESPVLNPRPPE